MRYCRRTFFNKLFQPHRIGKAIYKAKVNALKLNGVERDYFLNTHHAYMPHRTMHGFRRSKTPKNQIIGRHSMVKYFKARQKLNLRTARSPFLRRIYVSQVLDF